MKKIKIVRTEFNYNYTMGKLYIDDKYICDTLEDCYRDISKTKKIDGETCIPYGSYSVVLTWSRRFARVLPEVLKVFGFSGIRIHAGNSAKDTEGCILVGNKCGAGLLSDSRLCLGSIMGQLIGCGDISMEITHT